VDVGRPTELAGLHTGGRAIAPGRDADLVIFDPDATLEVTADSLCAFRHKKVSPYLGERLIGKV